MTRKELEARMNVTFLLLILRKMNNLYIEKKIKVKY